MKMRATQRKHAPLIAVLTAGVALAFATPALAAGKCPNEEFRTGASAKLPDCRAYELVTPEHLGRSQDTPFTGPAGGAAIPSEDGERLVLETHARLEPDPTSLGSFDVFSRTPTGWTMKSAIAPGASGEVFDESIRIFSPDLSQVAFASFARLNIEEQAPETFEVGPIGGPYAAMTEIPREFGAGGLVGANAGTASVAAFSDVLFISNDYALLPPGAERKVAEETIAGENLYEWSAGHLRLVAVNGEGKLLSRCGSTLAQSEGTPKAQSRERNAVSADGSKVFFTTQGSGPNCKEPGSLYIRVAGEGEPVEVSAPQGVKLEPSERRAVTYLDATPDGSEVFFATNEALTKEAPDDGQANLYEYDTEAPLGERLRFIANGVEDQTLNIGKSLVVSEDGSTVYYELASNNSYRRYDTRTGEENPVATIGQSSSSEEPSYTTPNGEFFVFSAAGVVGEPRDGGEPEHGANNGLFLYDNADKNVMCVSCGEGSLPPRSVEGQIERNVMIEPVGNAGAGHAVLVDADETPAFVDLTDNGQEAFFQTTAQLVPQDTNSSVYELGISEGTPGLDVYEWEADGAGGCQVSVGCTYLLSGGGDTGPSVFLGASPDGKNVFLASAAPLLPQATPEFTNIYDARVDGGFPPPASERECLSCQGVGSTAPLFGPGASGTFVGAGNPVTPVVQAKVKAKSKPKKKRRPKPKKRRKRTTKAKGAGKRAGGRS
jgi:hypothetical protein